MNGLKSPLLPPLALSLEPFDREGGNQDLLNLPADLDCQRLPKHVAAIMDGNGRWARQRSLPRVVGHRQGAIALKSLLRCCKDWGIESLTVYAFSTENWRRSGEEVNFLMVLFEHLLRKELVEMHAEAVRLRFIGELSSLPRSLQSEIEQAMTKTADNQAIQFNVAMNYGSRRELAQVCHQIAQHVQQGRLDPETIDETLVNQYLYTADLPDPDLLIRTSGERRLSNFLLWQLAYTELYFTDTLWPDFDRQEFHRALLAYQSRERRFGKTQASK